MAYFAEINNNGTVIRVISIPNSDCTDINGIEQEQLGIARCQELFKTENWVQTSYNKNIRKNYAGTGFTYDYERDAFIPPQPDGEGWILNEETCLWNNPAQEAEQAARDALKAQTEIGVTRV